jgi:integrase
LPSQGRWSLQAEDPPLADVIDRYIQELGREAGITKAQCLRTIKMDCDISRLKCSEINSVAISGLARQLAARGIEASTVGNYLSHLAAIVKVARPLWGYPLDPQAMSDASTALRATKVIGKSKQRERRPTLDELDKLMTHFGRVRHKRKDSIPMQAIVAFGIFSTRRMEEILRITWADLDEAGSRVLVRDMKDPKEKSGNHLWCELPPEACGLFRRSRASAIGYSRHRSTQSAPRSRVRVRRCVSAIQIGQTSRTCTSTICVTTAYRACSRWAATSRKSPA